MSPRSRAAVADPRGPPVRMLLGLSALALLLRLMIFSRSLIALDRLFIPDDTYYTLTVARSLAHGLGPATGGSTSSGFQPLLAFLMTPFYALGVSNDTALRIDLLLLLIADAATVFMIGIVAHRLAGRVAAVTAATAWAISPVAIAISLGGLESSLAVLAAATLLAGWMWAGDRPSAHARRWIVGGIAGLAILARIDLLLLVALLLIVELIWGSIRGAIATATGAAVVLAPWWLWCMREFGSPVPDSGAAAHRIAPFGAFSARAQALVAGTIAGGPVQTWDGLRQLLYQHSTVGVACFWVATLVFVAAATYAISRARRRPPDDGPSTRAVPRAAYVAVLCALAAGLMVFYAWFAVLWYFTRYLLPVTFVVTLLLAVLAARGVTRVATVRVVVPVLAIAVAAALFGDVHLFTARSDQKRIFIAATGYREAARRALARVPDGARIGAWQSGALTYYADRRVTVVNLDGVVNPDAPDPNDSPATARYITRNKVQWLADWPVKIVGYSYLGNSTLHPTPKIVVVATLRQGSGATLILARIVATRPAR